MSLIFLSKNLFGISDKNKNKMLFLDLNKTKTSGHNTLEKASHFYTYITNQIYQNRIVQ